MRRRRRLDIEETEQAIRELGWWHHHFQLPNGVWTGRGGPPGYNPIQRWEPIAAHLPEDLAGASVLDVGGNSGYFTVQMKLRGAGRCVMVEPKRHVSPQRLSTSRKLAGPVGKFVWKCSSSSSWTTTSAARPT